jgi:ATP-binding cassette subfamily F protein uup
MTPVFYIKDGNLSFADKSVLSDIELYISPGDRVCLVGRNGCGKSSLMKIITGEYELDVGELFKAPGLEIGYLKQDVRNLPAGTIYDLVLSSFSDREINRYNADIILNQLELDGNLELKNCSGGQVRRAFLAETLVRSPDILLLDEPTNHLDIRAIEWLESYVKSYKGAVVCISHDRSFLENVTNKVWWIDRGILKKSNRGFKFYDQWREEVITAEEAALRKANRKLEVEKSWLNTGVTARRKRNQKRLASLHRLRETLRSQTAHLTAAKAKVQLELSEEVKRTKFIIEAEGISYAYPGKKLFDNFSFKVKKGEKIGVIGPNGVGKSTLIKLLVKQIEPDSGRVKHGTNIEITYFDQHRSNLNPNHSLKQTICPGGGDQVFLKDKEMHVAGYLKKFLFDPKTLENKVSTLSGGEANRLLLAKSLTNPGNFFVLDEPTNDLDMDSIEMLLEILADYSGTLIIISHDRDFLERLVTRTIVFTEDDIIDLYGGYEDYLKYYKKQSKPERTIKNKPVKQESLRASAPAKLSYKYVRLLETLPKEIDDLENRIIAIEEELSSPDLYQSDNKKFNKLSSELEVAKLSLDKKMELWLEVEAMKEEMEK